MFMGTKTKYGYDVWFGFTDEMLDAVKAAMRGARYDVQRRGSTWGMTSDWVETRPIKWTIRWEPDIHGGIWVLYVSARAAIHEAERRCIRAVKERLKDGERVRTTYLFHIDGQTLPAGTGGWVESTDWQNGVTVFLDGISGERDIGKFWVVPVDDTPTTPKRGIYADERSVR